MRKNEPVSQHEIDYRESAIILSRSDCKGVVTEVNRDFSEISGFSHDESIGKPHNFLRHPDMPAVAFADLWRTIKSGRMWNGIVKNRAKNGDHYWVEANVAPVLDPQGRITAYVSVRTKPSRAQINAAESLYKDIAAGRARLPRPPLAARRLTQLLVVTPIVALAVLGALGAAWPVLVAVAAGLAAVLFWQIERLVFAPLDSLRRTMLDCQADGNLARRAKVFRDDDVGQLAKTYNALMLTMRGITSEVRNEATAVSREISELAALGSAVQTNGAAQQDATMQAAASLEEFTVASSSIADSAGEVKKAALSCRALIEHGHQRINVFQGDLDSISNLVTAIHDAAQEFRTSTNEIEKMVKHVREIADQTNLLALNAAIEAARAGEHGRGFAVVADEVRKLAGTSAGTASEIQRVTSEIVANADAVQGVVDNTLQSVARGQAAMKELTQVLADSDSQFSQTHRGVSDISSATHEQAGACTSLAHNVEAISQRGEENDRAMRELAALALRSNTRAGSLAELVARFK